MPKVTFDNHKTVTVPEGTMLIHAVRMAGLSIDAPCGGHGKCGKCSVSVLNGKNPGLHPSCRFPVTEDLLVSVPDTASKNRILESGDSTAVHPGEHVAVIDKNDSLVKSIDARIPSCAIGEAFSDSQCVKQVLGSQVKIPLPVASNLHRTLTDLDRQGNFVVCLDRLLSVRSYRTPCYVLAFDIGTTTIVSYLLDAETGRQVSVSSMLNPQTAYGADVISRCEYDTSHDGKELTALVRSAVQSLAVQNAKKAGITTEDIYFASIVGNTCMQHLYLGVSPESLICAPYTAAVDELQLLPASELGLSLHPLAQAAVFPSIAGFVGGDTVAVLLSLPADTFRELTLILDIGTNGELVLAKGDLRYTCSTAAGPAFEGARISCGMRGAEGAIDHAKVENGRLVLSTIGNVPPVGICGSGLIDLICCLLEMGILSSRGRIEKTAKWPAAVSALYGHRVTQRDGVTAFLLTDEETGIYLTQKDIREVQLAKSAIAAGIVSLCETMGVSPLDIRSVLLAGAFGSYLSPESACRIGLIPKELLGKIRGIGNAAGEGAKLAALSRSVLESSITLAENTRFVELATLPSFQNTYLSHLNF